MADLPAEPTTRTELADWVRDVLKISIPDRAVCPGHSAPLDYLADSFLGAQGADLLIWANRCGGKTMLAAVASLLEGLYRAPVSIRILGGSFDQSDRLADYLREFLSGDLAGRVEGRMTRGRIRLAGSADIRMLAQSQRAVRGQHAQRIRCDEVDLFDPAIWRAVQFATRSSQRTRAGIEVFSTLHRAGGLMDELVAQAMQTPAGGGFRLRCWCLWEVIERCTRPCAGCTLADDCHAPGGPPEGRARVANGFLSIDDAIAIKARSSRAAWEAEMLCKGARHDWLVFGEFDPARHVVPVNYRPEWPLYRAMDFGYIDPFVCLWIQLDPAGTVSVLDEYVCDRHSVEHHSNEIHSRTQALAGDARVEMSYVDPAGAARDATSGRSVVEVLHARGIPCTWRGSSIGDGLEFIRSALAPAEGPTRLKIDPRCRRLIRSFGSYHYPEPGSGAPDRPVKDGPDHAIDALRYFFANRLRPMQGAKRGQY